MLSEIDERVAALLRSPLGCAFLVIADKSGLTPKEIAQPDIALDLGAFAAAEMVVWRADHARESREMLRRGPQHADLARSILEESDTDWWFGPLDRDHQVYVPRDRVPPDPARLETPTQPPSTRTCSAVNNPPKVRWTASQSAATADQCGTRRPLSPEKSGVPRPVVPSAG